MQKESWVLGRMGFLFVMLFFARPAQAAQAVTTGWPNWRGPEHNGVSTEKGWLTTWPTNGPTQLWKVEVGPGHADPAVLNGRVYIMGRVSTQDVVFCLNADTGVIVWKYAYDAIASSYGSGPRATPAVDDKAVYTVSADGQVFCIEATSGKMLWNKNFQKELKLVMPANHFSTSAIIEGDLLLLNMGETGLALEKKTGNVVWKSDGDSGYSSPVPFTFGGKRCVALFAAHQLVVVDLANGQKIASYEWKTTANSNCADPVIVGDTIFVTSGYGHGSALLTLNGGNATAMWKKGYGCVYANPVLVGDHLYALIDSGWGKADLVCVSAKDGSEKWRQKDVGAGGLTVVDGKLLILGRHGDLILAAASPTAYTEIACAKIFPVDSGAKPKPIICWNSPVLCDGRVYVRNERGTLVCLDVRGK